MSYRIFTDATSDLPAAFAEQLDVTVLPMGFTMEEKEYFYVPGKSDMPIEQFFAKMRAGVGVTTAQVNTFAFLAAFEPVLQAGEDILYIGFSSKLSGTVQSAVAAAEGFMAGEPPDAVRPYRFRILRIKAEALVASGRKGEAVALLPELAALAGDDAKLKEECEELRGRLTD